MIDAPDNTFRARLMWVLGERKLTPWARRLGLSTGMVSRISAGHLPRPETLSVIARVEGVSLNWLLDGAGAPYPVAVVASDHDAADYIRGLQQDEDEQWQAYAVTSERDWVAVLTLPAEVEVNGRAVAYTAVEVVSGPLDARTLDVLDGAGDAREVRVGADDVAELARGWRGPYWLVGDDSKKGVLRQAGEITDAVLPLAGARAPALDEQVSEYALGTPEALTAAYTRLAERDPEQARRTLVELVERAMRGVDG